MKKIRKLAIFIKSYVELFLCFGKGKTEIYNDKITIEKAIEKNCSIIRLGDGEYRMINKNKDIHYQKYSDDLKKELKKIVDDYNNESKYILCVPEIFMNSNGIYFFKNEYKYLACFSEFRLYFRRCMKNKLVYGDAMCFAQNNKNIYKKLWVGKDYVVFVHNDEKWAKKFEEKYNIETYFIKVPSQNSYDNIEKIENDILNAIAGKENYSILISAGPTAKCLVNRLCNKGIISYDCGHCWDEPLIVEKGKK